jgi:peptidoglycan/LPS O-acetylase OafA/YrhL
VPGVGEYAVNRIYEFDGLRAIAVSLVVIFHATGQPIGGYLGVDIFFVLSGYLITTLLASEYRATGTVSLARFFGRRVLRIIPAMWTMIAVVVLCVSLSGGIVQWPAVSAASLFYIDIIEAAYGGGSDWVIGHLWSVATEERFYLSWPLILLAVMKYRPTFAVWVALAFVAASVLADIILLAIHSPSHRIYDGFDVRTVQLFIGCLLALSNITPDISNLASRFVWIPVTIISSLLLTLKAETAVSIPGLFMMDAVLVAWILIAVRSGSPINTALGIPIVVWVGRISYGLYVWHFPIVVLMRQYGSTIPWIVAGIVLSVAIAAVSYEMIEKPAAKLSKYRFAVKRTNQIIVAN